MGAQMAKKLYDLTLVRRGRQVGDVPVVTRTLDLEDQRFVDAFDSLLVKVIKSLVQRTARRPADEIHEYDLEVREHGQNRLLLTFHATADEVRDDK